MSSSIRRSGDDLAPRLARASRHGEHTLLYLRFHDVDEEQSAQLRRALQHVSRKLWGPVTLSYLGDADYALLLECWSVDRSLQLAGVLGTAVQRGFKRMGRDVWMNAGTVAVRGEVNAAELLEQAARACGSATHRQH